MKEIWLFCDCWHVLLLANCRHHRPALPLLTSLQPHRRSSAAQLKRADASSILTRLLNGGATHLVAFSTTLPVLFILQCSHAGCDTRLYLPHWTTLNRKHQRKFSSHQWNDPIFNDVFAIQIFGGSNIHEEPKRSSILHSKYQNLPVFF